MYSTAQAFFRGSIRVVFLMAYGAFLWASLHHIAYFFHSFEPNQTDWTGSYWLAVSIDVTALVMTIGVMFFRKEIGRIALVVVWLFIFGLTGFSWVVNWEYAIQFQNANLSHATAFQWINPILASSFAFLNLVYSVVGEFFNTKTQTADDLKMEIAQLSNMRDLQSELKALKKGTGVIATLKEKAQETKQAIEEVFGNQQTQEQTSEVYNEQTESEPENKREVNTDPLPVVNPQIEQKTNVIAFTGKPTKRSASTNKKDKVRKILVNNPDATLPEIMKKAGVSKGYASQVKNSILSEQVATGGS